MVGNDISRQHQRQQTRRQAIVAKAREMFLQRGFAATTMSAVAAAVGGSKTTLWSQFRNKDDLFAAVVDDLVERYGEALQMPLPDDGDPAVVLRAFGLSALRTITRPEVMNMHRMVIAEAIRSPRLGRMTWDRGAQRGQQRLAHWLAGQMARGAIRADDPVKAAMQFMGLCQSGSYWPQLLGATTRPRIADLGAEVDCAVEVFLRAYAATE